jgi:signal transduction histidine kinase
MAEAAPDLRSAPEAQTLRALLDISGAISGELDPFRIAQLAVDRSGSLVGADAAHLWLWDPQADALRALARSDACLLTAADQVSELGDSIIGQVFRRRHPVVVDDYQQWEHALPSVVASGVRSAVGVPLVVNERTVGVMVAHNYDRRTFTGQQIALLRVFAGHVAPALEAARLHVESEARRRRAEEAEEQVRALNADLEQRVQERTAELEAANHELQSFCYSVSHDLRAPLRSMDGFCQVLAEDYGDRLDQDAMTSLQRVRAASQRMAQLIDDLLQLSRITRAEMSRELVDLSGAARQIAEGLKASEPERQVAFSITPGLEARGDARLLRMVLQQLLNNAWKFTSTHPIGHIAFGRTQHRGLDAFFVRDDGVGFDMAYTDKLFGPFQRLHGMTEFDGTGIGLATVQRIINRHGGNIWAEAEVDKGACFYFSL